jgi:hypothetical protein
MANIFVYEQENLIHTYPYVERLVEQIKLQIADLNAVNKTKRRVMVGEVFPPDPTIYKYDPAIGDYRPPTTTEKVDLGIIVLANEQKIVNEQIVDKTEQELVDQNLKTFAKVKEEQIVLLNVEVDDHLKTTKTPSGWPVDAFSRERLLATFSMRTLPEDDPNRAPYIALGLTFPNDRMQEMITTLKVVQDAYAIAAADVNAIANNDVLAVRSIHLVDYL